MLVKSYPVVSSSLQDVCTVTEYITNLLHVLKIYPQ